MYYDPRHLKYWRKHQIKLWIRNLAYLILTHQSQVETLTLQIKGNYPGIGASQVTPVVKNPPANAGDITDAGLIPRLGRYLEEGMATHSIIFLPGEFRGQRNLTGYSP